MDQVVQLLSQALDLHSEILARWDCDVDAKIMPNAY
jgi:hypothetical protein